MKLATETIDVLKNFASINPSLQVKQGNVIRTISLSESVLARAKLRESFERDFAIYDLSNFISALSLFENANLEFSENNYVQVTDEPKSSSIKYWFADSSVIVTPPQNELEAPKSNIKFRLTKQHLQDVIKAVSVLQLPEVLIQGDGKTISIQAVDPKNPTSNAYVKNIADAESEFQAYIKVANLVFMSDDYDVSITPPKSKKGVGIAYFDGPVEYWVAVEEHSKF